MKQNPGEGGSWSAKGLITAGHFTYSKLYSMTSAYRYKFVSKFTTKIYIYILGNMLNHMLKYEVDGKPVNEGQIGTNCMHGKRSKKVTLQIILQ